MKQRLKQLIMSLALVLGMGATLLPAQSALAVNVDPLKDICAAGNTSNVCKSKDDDISDTIKTVINVLLFAVGVISVVMLIIGGIMYSTSTGDQARITKAKLTVTYAVAGLVVAFVAFAVVNFVVGSFK